MKFNINSETGKLEEVIVGIVNDAKFKPINPTSKREQEEGNHIDYDRLKGQVGDFISTLIEHGITVHRPYDLGDVPQLYVRDIGFVIDDKFIVANMKKAERLMEAKGLDTFIYHNAKIGSVVSVPNDATIEGGDIVVHGNYVFVGQSDRTNKEGYKFLKKEFTNKEVVPIYLNHSDNPDTNVLHLDCAFQPVGQDSAIIYDAGISNVTVLYDVFSTKRMIHITPEQRASTKNNELFVNVFSLDKDKVISDSSYLDLNQKLQKKGIEVIGIDYSESAKNGGLFRCSTLPLYRQD